MCELTGVGGGWWEWGGGGGGGGAAGRGRQWHRPAQAVPHRLVGVVEVGQEVLQDSLHHLRHPPLLLNQALLQHQQPTETQQPAVRALCNPSLVKAPHFVPGGIRNVHVYQTT